MEWDYPTISLLAKRVAFGLDSPEAQATTALITWNEPKGQSLLMAESKG